LPEHDVVRKRLVVVGSDQEPRRDLVDVGRRVGVEPLRADLDARH